MSLSQVFHIDAPDGLPAEAPRGSEGLLAYGEMVLRKGLANLPVRVCDLAYGVPSPLAAAPSRSVKPSIGFSSPIRRPPFQRMTCQPKLLRVSKAKSNTPSKRLVHLPEAALQWLRKCQSDEELIAPPWSMDRARACIREAGINCPDNGFRHSFITYRVAKTGNVDETALEAGNSRDMIFKHYRELASKDEGKAWFDLTPSKVEAMASGKHLISA